jgi:hypothetical protein
VRHAPAALATLATNLADVISLPDAEAALRLNVRMAAYEQLDRAYERSYAERTVIVREFERRSLWRYLTDPETGQPFPHMTAWLSCSDFLGCRRTNFEALRDAKLLADVASDKLIDVPKGNLKLLTQLSPAVRGKADVLEAARTLPREAFEEKVETEHPLQHIERRQPMKFSPGRSGAKVAEEAIAWALDHDIAGTRDEAFVRAMETALNEWKLDEELRAMPAMEETVA